MRLRVGLAWIAVAALAACDGGGAAPQAVFSPEPGARPSGLRAAETSPAPLGLPPPARMFAGTDSTVGAAVLFCRRSRCERPREEQRRTLVAPVGGLLTFAVHRTPVQARLEVATTSREEPALVVLNPGTLMAYGVDLPPGRYLLTLVARWEESEARWLFRLRVSADGGES